MIKSVTYLSEDKKSYELSDESDIQTLDTSVAEGSVARVTGKITAEYELRGGNWVKTAGGSGGGGSVEPLIVEIGPYETETETTGNLLRKVNTLYMNKTAGTIYEAYISGVPVVLIRQVSDGDGLTNVFNLTQTVKYKTGDIFAYVFIYREVVENDVFSRTFTANSEQEYPSMPE